MQQIKDATPHGAGVEAVVDAVGAAALDDTVLQTLTGPKLFAELVTGKNAKDIPTDIKHSLVFGRKVMSTPGASGLFAALGELLQSGKYKPPLPVSVAGQDLQAVEAGLETLKSGVSGTKLVVNLVA